MTTTAMHTRLFVAEHLRARGNEWVQRALRWRRLPKTAEDLIAAIYHFEDGTPPGELAVFYEGSWIVWRSQIVELPDVLVEETEDFVGRLRARLFCDGPDQADFDQLEVLVRELLTKRSASALESGKLPRSLRRVAIIDGQEPVARFTLSAEEIFEGAPG